MNLGLALVKPGESLNAEARRLWLSNLASWNLTPYKVEEWIDNQRFTDERLSRLSMDENIKGFDLARAAVQASGVLSQSARRLPSFITREQTMRNCQQCARVGYHCDYYNPPWLSHCPIHKTPLLANCSQCGAPWLNAFKVQLSRCSECGVRVSQSTLAERSAFDRKPYDETMGELVDFFNTEITLATPSSKFLGNSCQRRFNRFSRVLSYPSFLAGKRGFYSCEVRKARILIDSIYPTLKVPFVLSGQYASCDIYESEARMMGRVREKVYQRIMMLLLRHANHELGTCSRDLDFGDYGCFYCQMWFSMRRGFYRDRPTDRCSELLCFDPPRSRAVRVADPGIVSSVFDPKELKHYSLPTNITELLYYTDVWTAVRVMAFQIDFQLSKKEDPRLSPMTYDSSYRQLFGYYFQHLACFFFDMVGDVCNLYIPFPFISSQLRNHSDLIALTREF